MFNLNNVAKSMSNRMSENDDFLKMKDISEYELALRTMRVAARFAVPWNKTFVALENYMIGRKYCAEELQQDPNPGQTLCHFTDFVINENATHNHWRDGTGFLTTGDLEAWRSFNGASRSQRLRLRLLSRWWLARALGTSRRMGKRRSTCSKFCQNNARGTGFTSSFGFLTEAFFFV
jgi:hypothetical protein